MRKDAVAILDCGDSIRWCFPFIPNLVTSADLNLLLVSVKFLISGVGFTMRLAGKMARQSCPRSPWERLKCLCSNWPLAGGVRFQVSLARLNVSSPTPHHHTFCSYLRYLLPKTCSPFSPCWSHRCAPEKLPCRLHLGRICCVPR